MRTNIANQLLLLAKLYSDHMGLTLKTVSLRAAGRGGFLDSLGDGANFTIDRAERVLAWMAVNWPADLEWPDHVERPAEPKDEVA